MQLYDTKIQEIFNPVRWGSWHHNTSFKDGSILFCRVIVLIMGPRSPHTVLARLMKSAPLLPKLQFLIKITSNQSIFDVWGHKQVYQSAAWQYRFPLFCIMTILFSHTRHPQARKCIPFSISKLNFDNREDATQNNIIIKWSAIRDTIGVIWLMRNSIFQVG